MGKNLTVVAALVTGTSVYVQINCAKKAKKYQNSPSSGKNYSS